MISIIKLNSFSFYVFILPGEHSKGREIQNKNNAEWAVSLTNAHDHFISIYLSIFCTYQGMFMRKQGFYEEIGSLTCLVITDLEYSQEQM